MKLENESKGLKAKTLRDIKNLFEEYYKPVQVNNFWSKKYIDYQSNSDRYQTLSVEEYLDRVRPSLKGIINDLKIYGIWKTQFNNSNQIYFF